ILCVSPSASASWTAEVHIAPSHLQAGTVRSIEIAMVNISRTPADQPHWIHSFEILLEHPNGSLIQIVDHRMDVDYPNPENWTCVSPSVISNSWIVEVVIPDLKPGEYNITIIINSSQGSYENTSVSQSYASTLVIEDSPVERLNIAEILIAGTIVTIVLLFVIQVWRTRHDWG
ncbi:MAG TPA: hypothetical protein PKJ15_08595, partial [Methanomassiliicoccales archaeon]|nr:hypothetical protein [Methanomassiliicoccales archaeon]